MVVLQAVKFTDKKVPGLCLDLDEDLQAAGCFTEAPWLSNGSSGTRRHGGLHFFRLTPSWLPPGRLIRCMTLQKQ